MLKWLLLLPSTQPGGFEFKAAKLAFRGAIPVEVLLAIWGAFTFFCLIINVLESARSDRPRPFWVAVRVAARVCAIGLLTFVLAGPSIDSSYAIRIQRPLAVVVDNSQSMLIQDRRSDPEDHKQVDAAWEGEKPPNTEPSRLALAKWELEDPKLGLLENLQQTSFDPKTDRLELYLCGAKLNSFVGRRKQDLIKSMNASEPYSRLADAIIELVRRPERTRPTEIVLITDGADRGGVATLDIAADECKLANLPLFIYGIGAANPRHIRIRRLTAPPVILAQQEATVEVDWEASGFDASTAFTLEAKFGNRIVHTISPLTDHPTIFKFKSPEDEKSHELIVTISSNDQNRLADTRSTMFRIVDRKPEILVIEQESRWEFRFLRSLLVREQAGDGVTAKFWLASLPVKDGFDKINFPNRTELFEYDLVVLGDVPITKPQNEAKVLGSEQWKDLDAYVREGGGLLVVAGRSHVPKNYPRDSVLANLLPIDMEKPSLVDECVLAMPTLDGEAEPWSILGRNVTWSELPALSWHIGGVRARNATTVGLIADRIGSPILSWWRPGLGEVFFLGTDDTWRWRSVGKSVYKAFWDHLLHRACQVHLLGPPPTGLLRNISIEPVKDELEQYEEVKLLVRLLDKTLNPRKDASAQAQIHDEEKRGKPRGLTLTKKESDGDYQATLPTDLLGRYRVKLDDAKESPLYYTVVPSSVGEHMPFKLNVDELSKIAEETNGRFFRETKLPELADTIRKRPSQFFKQTQIRSTPPWPSPWVPFAIFLTLVLIEWVVRKRTQAA